MMRVTCRKCGSKEIALYEAIDSEGGSHTLLGYHESEWGKECEESQQPWELACEEAMYQIQPFENPAPPARQPREEVRILPPTKIRQAVIDLAAAGDALDEACWAELSPECRSAAYRVAECYGHAWAWAFGGNGDNCTRDGWILSATLAEIDANVRSAGPGPAGYGITRPSIESEQTYNGIVPSYVHTTSTGRVSVKICRRSVGAATAWEAVNTADVIISRPNGVRADVLVDLDTCEALNAPRASDCLASDPWRHDHRQAWNQILRALMPSAIKLPEFPGEIPPTEEECFPEEEECFPEAQKVLEQV